MSITISLTRDIAYMDSILRLPEMHERTRDDSCPPPEKISIGGYVADPRNWFLAVQKDGHAAGFFMLICKAPGIYEVHTTLLPHCHGAAAVTAGKLGRDWMFTNTDCRKLVSLCPEWLPESLVYAHSCGFKQDWNRKAAFKRDGKEQAAHFVSISLAEWVRHAAANFRELGHNFHECLRTAMEQLGHTEEPLHPEDENHDGMVGMVLQMAVVGNVMKAEAIYNEWAGVAGYEAIRALGERDGELAVDIKTAVIGIDHKMNIRVICAAKPRKEVPCQQQQQS